MLFSSRSSSAATGLIIYRHTRVRSFGSLRFFSGASPWV
jgi:hypothetical protein